MKKDSNKEVTQSEKDISINFINRSNDTSCQSELKKIKKIVDYVIVESSKSIFAQTVKNSLSLGYEPYGDPILTKDNWLMQAMILKK